MSDSHASIEKVTIPENHQAFCRELARLCKEHGLSKFSCTYRPHWKDAWREDIAMSWDAGRHGEDENKIYLNSTFRVHTKIDPEKP